jgi:nucleotide-binding universal stress UspA family protein
VTRLELARPGFAPPIYRVLLAHDLTGPAEIALVRAARLTLERQGHLTILHVVDSEHPTHVIEAQRTHARGHLEAEVRRWLGCRKRPYRIDIGVGDAAGAIAARARALDVDLVVTGRHHLRAFAHMFTPTTLGRLLRRIERPILVVGNPNQSPYRRVLMPVDFTNAAASRIRFAAAFLPDARLHLLHACKSRFQDFIAPLCSAFSKEERPTSSGLIGERPERAFSCLIETLRLAERRPLVTVEPGDPMVLVKRQLARQKTDLLVLGAPVRTGVEHMRIGGAMQTALESSSCDVLFLPPQCSWRLPVRGCRVATITQEHAYSADA